MADVNLPSIPDLAQLQFLPPGLNAIAGQNINTANQFQQQNLQMGAQDLRSKQLANMFQEQNDPTKLLQGKANLEGTNAENIVKRIEAEQRQTLAPEELEAKRAKFVKEKSDAWLEKAMNDAQQMMWSDDPAVKAKGQSLFNNSQKEMSQRAKEKAEVDKQREALTSHEKIAAGNNATSLGVARIGQEGRVARAGAAGKADPESEAAFWGAFNKMGSAKARHAALLSQAARFADDVEASGKWLAMAEQLRPQAEAEINGNKPESLDIGAIANKPTVPRPSIAPPGAVKKLSDAELLQKYGAK